PAPDGYCDIWPAGGDVRQLERMKKSNVGCGHFLLVADDFWIPAQRNSLRARTHLSRRDMLIGSYVSGLSLFHNRVLSPEVTTQTTITTIIGMLLLSPFCACERENNDAIWAFSPILPMRRA